MLLSDLSWPAVDKLPRTTPVVLPIAALEQHGPHLPLFTDSFLVGEVARRANEELNDHVLFAPVMWLGNSHHHLDFAGTMTAAIVLACDSSHARVARSLRSVAARATTSMTSATASGRRATRVKKTH